MHVGGVVCLCRRELRYQSCNSPSLSNQTPLPLASRASELKKKKNREIAQKYVCKICSSLCDAVYCVYKFWRKKTFLLYFLFFVKHFFTRSVFCSVRCDVREVKENLCYRLHTRRLNKWAVGWVCVCVCGRKGWVPRTEDERYSTNEPKKNKKTHVQMKFKARWWDADKMLLWFSMRKKKKCRIQLFASVKYYRQGKGKINSSQRVCWVARPVGPMPKRCRSPPICTPARRQIWHEASLRYHGYNPIYANFPLLQQNKLENTWCLVVCFQWICCV